MVTKSESSTAASKPLKSKVAEGPIKNRGCTDIICLLLFIAAWVGMAAVAIVGFSKGDPTRLVSPVDSDGNRCGYSASVKSRPYLLYFDIARCIQSSVFSADVINSGLVCNTPQVCVKACPSRNAQGVSGPAGQLDKIYCRNGKTLDEQKGLSAAVRLQLVLNNTCAPYYLKSEVVLNRCFPTLIDLTALANAAVMDDSNTTLKDNGNSTVTGNGILSAIRVASKLLNVRHVASKVLADFEKVWVHLIVGFISTIALCFVFIFLASIFLAPMVYGSMILCLALLGFAAYFCFTEYNKLKTGTLVRPTTANSLLDEFRYQTDTFLGLGIAAAVLGSILLLICLFLLSRIRFAIAVIKESTRAMLAIKTSFLFPLIPALMQCILFVYFVGVALFLVTSATPTYNYEIFGTNNRTNMDVMVKGKNTSITSGTACTPTAESFLSIRNASSLINCGFAKYDPDKVLLGMQIYHLVCWLWTANWISALGQCVLAGAFASYYWLHSSNKVPVFPIMSAFTRTLFYHTGSLAFGAAIITIVQIIRATLVFLETRLKHYGENPGVKFLLRCLQCLFACLERFLKFINKNAYIEIAVYGYNFCKAARQAFSLLLRNIVRVAAINGITSFILLMGRLVVTGAVGVVSYLVFRKVGPALDLHFYLGPVILLTLAAFFISASFFDTYDMAVDTIFLCVLEDLEHHDGSPEDPYFMSEILQKTLKVKNKNPSAAKDED